MIAFNAHVNYRLLNKLRALPDELNQEAHDILRDNVSRFTRQLVEKRLINAVPNQVWRGPFSSPDQQAAYWATRGFDSWAPGANKPPTMRSGKTKKWHVRAQYRAKSFFGEIIVNNLEMNESHTYKDGKRVNDNIPYWQYVIGGRQQGFHERAGWYNVDQEITYIKNAVGTYAVAAFRDLFEDKLKDLG